MHSRRSPGMLLGCLGVTALALSGCSTAPGSNSDDSALVRVVASTDVYGDIAARIGGELVAVTSIISGPTQDPHSYEATAQDQLALSKADLVIENGGGYDPFIGTMLKASGGDGVVVVNASEASGLLEGDVHAGDDGPAEDAGVHGRVEGFNEHVWYSFHAVENIAAELAHELAEIDEANADAYDENLAAFVVELDALRERAHALHDLTGGKGVAITEPVPTYLLGEVGLENRTPEEFSEAIEEGTDVAPAVLRETLALFADDFVVLLAYNAQTAGAETEQVRAAADVAGVAVVSLTETLPADADYVGWMSANLDAIEKALS
jgi:zinc/manganese transport system substrate-binding protein